jgi:hypothetical protein
MKKILTMSCVLFFASSCDLISKRENTDEAFLSGGAKPRAEGAPADPNTAGDVVSPEVLKQIKVSSADWDKLTISLKQCQSEREIESTRGASEIDAALSKGKMSCLESLDRMVNDKAAESLRDTIGMAEEFKRELLKYKFGYAIVNGDCIAKMSDGHLRTVRVKGDACLSVPFVKIGTGDGEVKGIQEAVSSEAMTGGILSLSCDVGRSHIRMTAEPCSAASGSASKTTFERIEAK